MGKQFALCIGCNSHKQNCLRRDLCSAAKVELHKAPNIQVASEMVKKYFYCLILIYFDTAHKGIFRFCSSIHCANPDTIIIVLMTTVKLRTEKQLFECGVNDVVAGRQTSVKSLTARALAHLRNRRSSFSRTDWITLKGTLIDFDRREVQRNGSCCQLRGILVDLLKYFLAHPNRIISREELQRSPIWADSIVTPAEEGGKTFDVNVGKLRKIIESDPTQPQIIKSVRGVGWKLAKDVIELKELS